MSSAISRKNLNPNASSFVPQEKKSFYTESECECYSENSEFVYNPEIQIPQIYRVESGYNGYCYRQVYYTSNGTYHRDFLYNNLT